jgi:hypothetical protein
MLELGVFISKLHMSRSLKMIVIFLACLLLESVGSIQITSIVHLDLPTKLNKHTVSLLDGKGATMTVIQLPTLSTNQNKSSVRVKLL